MPSFSGCTAWNFYRVADGQSHMLAHPGWAFVYPTMWLLILGGVYLLVPDAWAATQYIDIAWRWAEKTPIIIADLAIGVCCTVLYPAPGGRS